MEFGGGIRAVSLQRNVRTAHSGGLDETNALDYDLTTFSVIGTETDLFLWSWEVPVLMTDLYADVAASAIAGGQSLLLRAKIDGTWETYATFDAADTNHHQYASFVRAVPVTEVMLYKAAGNTDFNIYSIHAMGFGLL